MPLALLGVLAACAETPTASPAHMGKGFAGWAVAEEPRAVAVAQEVLRNGGSAADAAVALYFSTAVARPSVASLGAGGACLVHDPAKKTTETVEFMPAAAPVPLAPRGFYALHAKYGRQRWEALLIPAERAARDGAPVSRAFAADLAAAPAKLQADPELRRLYGSAKEGDMVAQPDLAMTLARLRARGPVEFHSFVAAPLAAAARGAGIALDEQQVRQTLPLMRPAVTAAVGNDRVHFPTDASGEAMTRLWTSADPGSPAPASAPAKGTGFVTVDGDGQAVACTLTMNEPFGSGRMAAGTGILLAAAPAPLSGPVMIANPNVHELRFAGAAAPGSTAALSAALDWVKGGKDLAGSLQRAGTGAAVACSGGKVRPQACQAAAGAGLVGTAVRE